MKMTLSCMFALSYATGYHCGSESAMVIYFSSDIRLPPFHLVGAGGGCISRCESAKE